MMKPAFLSFALTAAIAAHAPAAAQSADPTRGRHIAETVCSTCHQIDATSVPSNTAAGAPSFVDISRMPSTTELAIKVFLQTSHPTMPNIVLSRDEMNSIAAYILSLARNPTGKQ